MALSRGESDPGPRTLRRRAPPPSPRAVAHTEHTVDAHTPCCTDHRYKNTEINKTARGRAARCLSFLIRVSLARCF